MQIKTIMKTSQDWMKENETLIKSFIKAWLIIFTIFIINEILLRYLFGLAPFKMALKYLFPYIFIPTGLLLIGSRKILFSTIAILTLLQMIWFGSFRYFGTLLAPDAIIVGFHEAKEVSEAMASEWQVFITPVLITLALSLLFTFIVIRIKTTNLIKNTRLGLFIIALPFLIVTVRSALHSNPFLLNPTRALPSHLGVTQAFVLAIRDQLSAKHYNHRNSSHVIHAGNRLDLSKKKVTVVLIMGESISPMELGIFGSAKATTPLLTKRLTTPSKLTYFPKIGFAAGMMTLSSIPLTLRMSYNPIRAFYNKETIFELARKQNFAVGYYSAQKLKILSIAGGRQFLNQLETLEEWQDRYQKKGDDIILDQISQSPIKGNNQFYFIHQRTNHTPYDCHIKTPLLDSRETRDNLHLYEQNDKKRLKRYRQGLRCFDESLDKIFAHFEEKEGDVYIFFASDHNELLGEHNIWGHGNMNLQTALIPMILATNRPNSSIAQKFATIKIPTAFQFIQLATEALGQPIKLNPPSSKFFINGVIAYGRQGYYEMERTAAIDRYKTTLISPSRTDYEQRETTMLGLKDIYNYIQRYKHLQTIKTTENTP